LQPRFIRIFYPRYSDGAAACASTVAAFAKRGDLILVDEGVYEALGTGVTLSRANVKYFKHNDMDDLRRVMERVRATDISLGRKSNAQKRFIVVEGLYKNHGTICPLDELVKLKHEFCYRLILDESHSFGVLGKTGRGTLEHFGLSYMSDAEIVTISLENSLASVGGVTVGNEEVVDHQRLSGAGYCFSASSPPFLARAAQASLKTLATERGVARVHQLQTNMAYFHQTLMNYDKLRSVIPDLVTVTSTPELSPLVYLKLVVPEDESKILSREEQCLLWDKVANRCMDEGLLVVSTGRHVGVHLHKKPSPALKVVITAHHSKEHLDVALQILGNAMKDVLLK
jgi:serine palmitoyltransferase